MESDGSCNLTIWGAQRERIPKGIYTAVLFGNGYTAAAQQTHLVSGFTLSF